MHMPLPGMQTEWSILSRVRCLSDSAELLEALVSADLADIQAVLAVDPATVRPEFELARFASLLAPCAELLAVRGPDLDSAPADDVEDPLTVHGHVARVVHPGDLRNVVAVHVNDLPAQVLPIHDEHDSVGRDVDVMRQVELARIGGLYAGNRPAAKPLDEDRIASSPGKDQFTLCRKAVDPVLSVAVRNEDVAVGGLNRSGRH